MLPDAFLLPLLLLLPSDSELCVSVGFFGGHFLQNYRLKSQTKQIVIFHDVQYSSTNTTAGQTSSGIGALYVLEEKQNLEGCA